MIDKTFFIVFFQNKKSKFLRKNCVLLPIVFLSINVFSQNEKISTPKRKPKESKIELKGGVGVVILPPFQEKLDIGGNLTNIYSGFKPTWGLWGGCFYKFSDNLYAGGSIYSFYTAKRYYKLGYINYAVELRYNFSPTTALFSPYTSIGLNMASIFLNRKAFTQDYINPDTSSFSGSDVIVNRVKTNYGALNLTYPSFGLISGLGLQYRRNNRISYFLQMNYFFNISKREKLIKENYIHNRANLHAFMLSAGLTFHLGGERLDKKLTVKKINKKQNFNKVQVKNNYKRPKKGKANKPDPNRKGTYTARNYAKTGEGVSKNQEDKGNISNNNFFYGKQLLTKLPSNTHFNNPVAIGKITSENGKSVSDVDVLALDENGKILGASRTDKNGYFSFSKLNGKNASIVLATPTPSLKAVADFKEQDPSLSISENQFKKFEYNKLDKKFNHTMITGKLNINSQIANANDVEILLLDKEGNIISSTKTKNGFFTFQKLPPGNYQVVINSNDPTLKAQIQLSEQDSDLFIPQSSFSKANLSKLSSKEVSLIISGKAYSQVSQINVSDIDVLALNDAGEVVATTKTNKTGGFSFKNLHPSSYQIVINSQDPKIKAKANVVNLDPELKISAENFKFSRLETKKNTVVGKINSNVNPAFASEVDVFLLNDDGEVVAETKSDRAGFFSFTKLDPANYQIAINSNNPTLSAKILGTEDGTSLINEKDFYVKNANLQKLRPSPLGHVIVGNVMPSAQTSNVADVEVYLLNEAGEILSKTKTNNKGNFIFTKLPQGNYQVVVANGKDNGLKANAFVSNVLDNSYLPADEFKKFDYQKLNPNNSNNVVIGKFDVNAVKTTTEDIGFLMLDENGVIVEEIYATKSNGQFIVNNVKTGNYTFVPKDAQNAGIETKVYVANADPTNQITPKDFISKTKSLQKLEPTNRSNLVIGKIFSGIDSDKLSDVSVLLIDDNGKVIAETKTNPIGRFQFNTLPKGNYKVVINHSNPNFKANVLALEEEPGIMITSNSFKRFDYQKLNKIENDKNVIVGKIEATPYFKSISDQTVLLIDDDGNFLETKTDKNGYFTFTNLPGKNYRVIIDSKNPEIKPKFNVAYSDPELYLTQDEISKNQSDMLIGNIENNTNPTSKSNVEILMLNEKGEILDKTQSDVNGNFVFKKLPIKTNIQIIINSDDPGTNSTVRLLDSDPDLKLNIKEMYKYNPVSQKYEALQSFDRIRITGVLSNQGNSKNSEIYLVNESGEIVAKAQTKDDGVFTFSKVPAKENLRFVFQNSEQKINAKFQIFQDQESFDAKPSKPAKVFNSVYFDHNQTELTPDDKLVLDKVIAYLKANPKTKMNLNGFGDNSGSYEANMNITRKRAEAVMIYLVSQGISKERLKVNPMGKAILCKSKYYKEDQKLNRRVDLEIIED